MGELEKMRTKSEAKLWSTRWSKYDAAVVSQMLKAKIKELKDEATKANEQARQPEELPERRD